MGRLSVCLLWLMLMGAVLASVIDSSANRDNRHSASTYFFRITRVSKTHLADVAKFRVRVDYEASHLPEVYLRTTYEGGASLVGDQPMGHVEVEVDDTLANAGLRVPQMYFYHLDTFHSITLDLRSSQNSVTLPPINITRDEGMDIRYQSGERVVINFNYKVGGDFTNIKHEQVDVEVLMKSVTEETVVDRYYDALSRYGSDMSSYRVWIEPGSLGGTVGERRASLIVNSTSPDPEGLLNIALKLKTNCSGLCLVDEFSRNLVLRFFREDHVGPFPQDFFGFVHDEYLTTDFYCPIERPVCTILCETAGNLPAEVEISRIMDDGSLRPTNDVSSVGQYFAYSVLTIPNADSDDAGNYICKASVPGKEITQTLSLNFVSFARIDRSASYAVRFANGTVKFSCTAKGDPRPRVTFEDNSSFDQLGSSDFTTRQSFPTPSTTRVEVQISDPAKAAYISWVYCKAKNVDKLHRENYFYMEVQSA